MRRGARWHDWLWLLMCAALSSVWCLTTARQIGATFDEPIYIERGLEGWRTGSHHGLIRMGTMPLPAEVQTLPLYLAERWRGRPWDLNADCTTVLTAARAGNLPFWWLLLFCGWRMGRSLAGDKGGRLAVAVLACEPNLLAHASLATTDIAVTACLLLFALHYRNGRSATVLNRIVVPGGCLGLALMAKASAIVFGPLIMFGCYVAGRRHPAADNGTTFREPLREFVADGLRIGLVSLAVMAVLCGCDWRPLPSFVDWANQLPPGAARSDWLWFAEHLRIFSNGFEGIVRQIKHNASGHGTFLLGEARMGAFWYYFPVVATIKLTLPFLFAPFLLLVVRPRSLWNWAFLVALVLFAFSLTYRVQIGIRMLLPCVGFAVVGLSVAAVEALRVLRSWPSAVLLRGATIAGVGWVAAGTVAAGPNGLCYVNELWGGRRDGYRLVGDSNYDWGQGLRELARWQSRHMSAELDVWYFGTDPALKQLPLREVPFHTLPVQRPEQIRERVGGHYLAVGTSILYGHGLTESHREAAVYLRTLQPTTRTTTFLIYDFTHEPGPAAHTRHDAPSSRGGS